ncbi:MAG: SseB family protein [Gammaproteobacteria bacterium]|nr:SseB family protein [Gammaproteobacteria bacterium]
MNTEMHDSFHARNELEEKLMATQEGQMNGEAFMDYLMDTQVFMPVKDSIGIEGFTGSDKAIPLTLNSEDDIEVLILFTSPERARDFVQAYPGYAGGLLAEFSWILQRTGSGIGISINPNWPVGMDLEPDMVQQLKVHQGP